MNKPQIPQEDIDKLYEIVEITAQLFEKHKIKYTIEGGTLLGAVRNGGLIPLDDDADFDVLKSDASKILALAPEFAKHGLEIIPTPGWGLQISFASSREIEAKNLWTLDNKHFWTSKWPFLDLLYIGWDNSSQTYKLTEDIALHDYPDYHLLPSDWNTPFDKIAFGHLFLNVIAGEKARKDYLDRNYPQWETTIRIIMDHESNTYLPTPFVAPLLDTSHMKHSSFF